MRALAISDTHFGAWTGDDLLSHPFALERLAPHLDDIDELILLGDLFDLLFSTVENAVARAQGFLDLVAERLHGKRVVFIAGNHDHHTMVRELEESVRLRIADGMDAETAGRQAREQDWLRRYLERRLAGVEVEIAYPSYWVGRVLLFHGHYLDAHMEGSLSNRMLTRTIWKVAGGRPADRLTIEDYESVIVPLTELLYVVAQLPHGTAAQQSVYDQIGRLGRLLAIPGAPARGAKKTAGWAADGVRALRDRRERRAVADVHARDVMTDAAGAPMLLPEGQAGARPARTGPGVIEGGPPGTGAGMSVVRPATPSGPTAPAVAAMGQVVRNLGWNRETDMVVFAHTHQPLARVVAPGTPGKVRFWNTGSWIYEPSLSSSQSYLSYLRHGWPGTGVLIDTDRDEPELVSMLADLNPLERARAAGDRGHAYREAEPFKGTIPSLEDVDRGGRA
jgi:UDP-2,3-diacylglucosamine pyrophosphatase LpxH